MVLQELLALQDQAEKVDSEVILDYVFAHDLIQLILCTIRLVNLNEAFRQLLIRL